MKARRFASSDRGPDSLRGGETACGYAPEVRLWSPIKALGGPWTSATESSGDGGPLPLEAAGREVAAWQVVADEVIAKGNAVTRGVGP